MKVNGQDRAAADQNNLIKYTAPVAEFNGIQVGRLCSWYPGGHFRFNRGFFSCMVWMDRMRNSI